MSGEGARNMGQGLPLSQRHQLTRSESRLTAAQSFHIEILAPALPLHEDGKAYTKPRESPTIDIEFLHEEIK